MANDCLWPGCHVDWVADKLLPAHPIMAALCRRSGPRFCRAHEDEFFSMTGHLDAGERASVFRALVEA
jgi:hypothetical protein